jgi:hypothetical protein
MRVKLTGSAESAEQHSPGWKSERNELWNPGLRIGFRLSPARAMQTAPPLQGLYYFHANPGLRPLRSLHPGLCCIALSALISLSLTRKPYGARMISIHIMRYGVPVFRLCSVFQISSMPSTFHMGCIVRPFSLDSIRLPCSS